jgi:CubicO group peptidase (beta-lactamase class C family)
MRSLWSLGSFLLLAATVNSQKPADCPLFGPAFPAPTNLSKNPLFLKRTEDLTANLTRAIENGDLPSISFAVQIFSSQEDQSAFGFYHTDKPVQVGTVGVQEVDEDTVFRIGSVSKLWTMFLYMTLGGTKYFNEPISKYVPELRARKHQTQTKDLLDHVQWSDVTIGELASHQAGILRDCR